MSRSLPESFVSKANENALKKLGLSSPSTPLSLVDDELSESEHLGIAVAVRDNTRRHTLVAEVVLEN